MRKIVEKYCEMPAPIKRPLWRLWHKLLIRFDKDTRAVFLNYGYHDEEASDRLHLKHEDEPDRYCIQLYDVVANRLSLKRKDVIEVGSGRGGGASFLSRYFAPRTYRAFDISADVVSFCNRYYDVEGLTFHKGCAENLPVKSGSCDVVVNVESARCYRDINRFFSEVKRILRPGGHFLFADMIPPDRLSKIRQSLQDRGFHIREQLNITKNVVTALALDSARREQIIQETHTCFPGEVVRPICRHPGNRTFRRIQKRPVSNTGRFKWRIVYESFDGTDEKAEGV
jgi:SAM-dependent methyltransferase